MVGKKEEPTQFMFVILASFSGLVVGEIHKSEISSWKEKGKIPKVLFPRLLQPTQTHDGTVRIQLVPFFPLRSSQKEVSIMPNALEVVGDITLIDGEKICRSDANLYDTYKEAILQSIAERSGIVSPTATDVARVREK